MQGPLGSDSMIKVPDQKDLLCRLASRREAGGRMVFTNGCFDLLHAGHVRYLAAARREGDFLVVGLNSDRSVRSVKGENRPIVPQDQRAEVLSALACVDFVILFDAPDPLSLIRSLRPDVLVKGSDWPEDKMIGADFVLESGGRVVRIPVMEGISSTSLIEKILRRFAASGPSGTRGRAEP